MADSASSAVPELCAAGCGFYANNGTGLCSKCGREQQQKEQQQQQAASVAAEALATPDVAAAAAAAASAAAAAAEVAPSAEAPAAAPAAAASPAAAALPADAPALPQAEDAAAAAATTSEAAMPAAAAAAAGSPATPADGGSGKPSTRCASCRKKVGLTGFTCRCGHLFCGQHRYAEAHDCTFDYKQAGRQALAAANPLVQASKVDRI